MAATSDCPIRSTTSTVSRKCDPALGSRFRSTGRLPGAWTTHSQGTPLEVLWEREIDAELCRAASWRAVADRGFDPARLFSAYYHTLRWNCVTATNPRLFQAPYRAGIRVEAYQLEPLKKALLLPRVNLFIADDVGLGKTLDTLRTPRRPDQKVWEWRKDSPVRPIVFEDPGRVQSDVAHLHLEHRVVQRLLGRFIAQGFLHDDLSRACVAQGQDGVRRVVVLGRLSLFGERAARLHDEIFAVAARWLEPAGRAEPLKPYAAAAEERTLELLETALGNADPGGVPPAVRSSLAAGAERDLAELAPHLRARGLELSSRAEVLLGQRGKREAREMAALLEAQQARIRRTAETHETDYKIRLFAPEELRQLEADKRHWQR